MTELHEMFPDLKPVPEVFRPGAAPEFYIADAPTDDERYYVPLSDTVATRPLLIAPSQNRWCDVLMSKGPGFLNRHYHPHQVFAFTLSGKWRYLEHSWVATAGDFLYETPGEAHTLVMLEASKVHFNVTGPLVYLDEDGQVESMFDVFDYIKLVKDHYAKNGIGTEYIDKLIR
jgi:2,4'-dihydroxyacetophenone dioxygenase